MIGSIISVIFVFGIIIFIHEFGHFLFAKASKVGVNEFSIGMGPSVYSWKRKETLYSIRLIPLGGYNMMEDDREKENCFQKTPFYKKVLILLAGAFFNLVLGCVLLSIITAMNGYIGTTVVAEFNEGAVSSEYLELGDEITHLNGHRVRTNNDITYELLRDKDGLIDVGLIRDGEKIEVPVQFKMEEVAEGVHTIMLDFKMRAVYAKPLDYITYPVNWGLSILKQVWGSLIDLFTGRAPVNQLAGPVGIVTIIGQTSKMGIKPILLLTAFISINLGIFNLLPLPILDGGRILMVTFEKIRGRELSEKANAVLINLSTILILFMVLFATKNDIFRLFKI